MIRYLVREFNNNKCAHYLSIRLSICLSVRKPVFPSKQLLVYNLSDCPLGRLFIRLSNCPPVNLFLLCMSAWQHLGLSVCSLLCCSLVRLFVCLIFRLCVCYLTSLFICLRIYLFACLFVTPCLVFSRLCTDVPYSYFVHAVWLYNAKTNIQCFSVFLIFS